jgi:hypothetical protein
LEYSCFTKQTIDYFKHIELFMQFYVILEERFKGPGPSCKISPKKSLARTLGLYLKDPQAGRGGSKDPFTDDKI